MDYILEPLRKFAVELSTLSTDPANANTHPDKNLRAIKDSLAAFGQRQVIVARADNRVVIAGNGRLLAAHALGWSHIACIFVEDDDVTALRYAIADNRSSELSEWDNDVLTQLLQTIKDDFGTVEDLGFDDADLDALLGFPKIETPLKTNTEEVDVDEFELECRCPRCGFEFDP